MASLLQRVRDSLKDPRNRFNILEQLKATEELTRKKRQEISRSAVESIPFVEQKIQPVASRVISAATGSPTRENVIGKILSNLLSIQVTSPLKGIEYLSTPSKLKEETKKGKLETVGAYADIAGLLPFLPFGGLKSKAKVGEAAISVIDDIVRDFEIGRQAAKQAKPGLRPLISARSQLLDRLSPVFDLIQQSTKELPAEVNPYKRMRLLAGVGGKVQSILDQGLSPILKQESKRLDDLSTMLVLDREKELIGRGLIRKRTLDQVNQGYQELRARHGAEGYTTLTKSADDVRAFGNNLLDQLKNSGIISKESYQTIKKNNQFYVPFEIVEHMANNLEKGNYARASYNVARQDVIHTIGSTEKAVADPLEALVRKTAKITALTEKNNAIKTLVNLRKVDPDVFSDIKQVKGALPEGYGTINLFENGKQVAYQVPELVEGAVKNLDAEASNILVEFLSVQARVLRAGAVSLNIGFLPTNVVRDFSDAVLTDLSEKGVRAAWKLLASYPKAIFAAVRRDDLYNQWVRAGGTQATLTEQLFKRTPQTVQELAGLKPVIKTVISSPKNLVEFANRVGEQSTRLARYRAGILQGESVSEAAFKSRDISLDFAKSGTRIRALNRIVPFLNAGIQGSEKLLRIFKHNPKQALFYSTLLYGMPSALLYKHNSQFEDFKDIPQSERATYWIMISRDRTPEEKTAGEKVQGFKVPKGFLGRMFSSLTDAALDFTQEQDPQSFGTFMAETIEAISPIGLPITPERVMRTASQITPPWSQALLEAGTNRSFFYGQPIVPRSLEGVEPQEQYRESTSEVAKLLGRILNISPLKIEQAVTTTTAGLGRQALLAASGRFEEATAEQISRRFVGIRSGASVDKDFEEVAKYKTKASTESLKRKREATKLYEEWNQLPKAEAQAKAAQLKKDDPLLYEKLKDVIDEKNKGLTPLESFIKTLPVQDGSRATYVKDKLKSLNKQEKEALIKLWITKGIISENIYKQLQAMSQKEAL